VRDVVAHWNRIFALSDAELAAKIQADGIDILVDLTGHTAHSRLLTFARKPAPIQCGWIGYLGTSGLSSIDYYLADAYFLPPGEFEPFFTEKIVHLPIVSPFRPSPDAPDLQPLPARSNGHITFGSFSRLSKLSQPVIALWSELMRALPNSRILLAGMPRDGRHESLSQWFEAEGIAPERLQFHRRCADRTYLELHHQIDIALDPFPFTGATTTSNALWMGVPTLTLTGRTVAGRLGPALLEHAGLTDFVAHSPQDFIEKGVHWANHLDALAALRAGMRERFLSHPIGQPAAAAEGLSTAFRQMWRGWCAEAF
jgi:protein O-GlcNAc transferase